MLESSWIHPILINERMHAQNVKLLNDRVDSFADSKIFYKWKHFLTFKKKTHIRGNPHADNSLREFDRLCNIQSRGKMLAVSSIVVFFFHFLAPSCAVCDII